MTRIVLCYPVAPRHVRQIQAAAPDAEVVATVQTGPGMDRIATEILAAEVVCPHTPPPCRTNSRYNANTRKEWIMEIRD